MICLTKSACQNIIKIRGYVEEKVKYNTSNSASSGCMDTLRCVTSIEGDRCPFSLLSCKEYFLPLCVCRLLMHLAREK